MAATYKTAYPACGPAAWAADGRRAYRGGVRGPTNTVAPVVSGTETVGETLSCTEGTWSGEGSITYAYQWLRDGASIGGATSATYELAGADEDALISCRVTATDNNGPASANSNSVGPITTPAVEPWTGYYAAAGITNGTAQSAIANFFAGLSTDGIQSKVKVFVITGGEAATAKNVMSDAYHGSLVNSPTFTQWVGVRGDGATSYIDTVTALGSITGVSLNKTTVGIFTKQDAPVNGDNTTPNYMAAESYVNTYETTQLVPGFLNASNQQQYNLNYPVNDDYGASASTAAGWGDLNSVRLYAMRTGASAVAAYKNATEIATNSVTSVAIPTCQLTIAAYNADGSIGPSADDATFDTWGYVIAALDNATEQAALDARVATLRTALEAL